MSRHATTFTHESDWFDLTGAVKAYPLSRRSFWYLISSGKLPAYRPFGRKILLRRSDIEKVLAEKRVNIIIDDIVDDVMRELKTK